MKIFVASGLLASLMLSNSSAADSDDSVFTTYSENGAHQIDFKSGTFGQTGQPSQDAASIGVGYGVTDICFSEIYLSYTRTGAEDAHFDSGALQNTFLLTGGQNSVDVGLYTEIEYEQDRSAGYQLTFGPMLQTEFGLTTVNFNLLFQRNYRDDFTNPMQLGYQWQVKRHGDAPIDFGMQGFGELGQWDRWAPQIQQSHRFGPALFGKIFLDEHQALHYNAAILFDVLDQTHATTFRMQIVYGY